MSEDSSIRGQWVDATVGDVTSYQKAGGTPAVSNRSFYGGDIPFVVIEDMTRNSRFLDSTKKTITPSGLRNSAAWLVRDPHILYSMYATVGKPIINRIECATNQAIIALKENEKIDQEYLFYVLVLIRGSIWKFTTQTTQSNLNAAVVRRLPVTYPRSLPTQQKIARILQTVDRAMEKTEALIEKYQQIKAGLMHDLFTRGLWTQEELDRGDHQGTPAEATAKPGQLRPIRQDAPHLYQETPIGWIPKAWHHELLDQLADRGSGHTPSKSHPEYWNGGIKWISLADSQRLDQLYIDETDFNISTQGLQNSSAVLHPPGIVVLSRDAGIGKSAITTKPMAVSQHFMCWKCDERMDNHFLYYWLQNNKRTFENIAMGSTILTIGLSYFKRLRIACPRETVEQSAIAVRLRSIDEKLFTLETDLKKKSAQKSGMMHDLLTGKVPVTPDS